MAKELCVGKGAIVNPGSLERDCMVLVCPTCRTVVEYETEDILKEYDATVCVKVPAHFVGTPHDVELEILCKNVKKSIRELLFKNRLN